MKKYANYHKFGLLFLMFLMACNQSQIIIDENISIYKNEWHVDQNPTFKVDIKDTLCTYKIFLNLRHTSNFPYSKIFILVHEKTKNNKDTTIRTAIDLAEPDGQWIGYSTASLHHVQYLLHENYTFADTGKYEFKIEHNMQQNPLKNIVDIGLKVVKQ